MSDGEWLYVPWSLVYWWDHNIQSCLSESVSESYSSLSEYRRLGFFPTLADLQPSLSLGLPELEQAVCLLYSVILRVSFLPIVFLPSPPPPVIGIVWKSEVA